MTRFLILTSCLLLLLAACEESETQAPLPSPTSSASPSAMPSPVSTDTPIPTASPTPVLTLSSCALQPVVAPTMPAVIPGYTELDRSTGLHMTGSPKQIDLETYRLEVTGFVDHPLKLTYDELRCLPRVESDAELVCPGFFTDHARWAGASLQAVMALAGIQKDARQLNFYGADGYQAFVSLADALQPGNFLAYEWNGEPLPILHGFPLRTVFPRLQGNKWVKWLFRIEVQ